MSFAQRVVGAFWGVGHTVSLLVIGVIVLSLRIAIPEIVSNWLEFGVALMIIGLGVSALWRASRKNSEVHIHQHNHDGVSHTHVHFHEKENKHQPQFSCRSLTRSFTSRMEAGSDWNGAWARGVRSVDVAGNDAD